MTPKILVGQSKILTADSRLLIPGLSDDVLAAPEHDVGEDVSNEGGHLQHAPEQPGVPGYCVVIAVDGEEVSLGRPDDGGSKTNDHSRHIEEIGVGLKQLGNVLGIQDSSDHQSKPRT